MERLCKCGCGTPLKSRWPFIKGHGKQPPLHTRAKGKAARGKAADHPAARSRAITRSGNSAVATLCVSESHLDNYWMKLSLEEKTAIVQKHLEGVGL